MAHRAVGPVVRQRALDVAKALGRKWKREHTEVHEDATTAHAQRLLFGTLALDRLGMHFATLKAELREFLAAHDSHNFLGWHPAQRGPDGHFTSVSNRYTIRDLPEVLPDDETAHTLAGSTSIAQR